jgi:aminoglycoside phosphotransferase (APT) family kinase protein
LKVIEVSTEVVRRELQAAWPGAGVSAVRLIPESHSGFTYFVEGEVEGAPAAGVLRLTPPGARPLGPADMARQARIMAALGAVGLPVPRILAASAEPVLDGRPFVLMERVDGVRIEQAVETASPRDLVARAFAAIRAVHELPAAATGLAGEQPMAAAGEVERWQALRGRSPEDLVREAPRLEERLLAALPASRRPALVHGDYHLGNLLFREGEVVAILDWEISELGQAPLDEAALCLVAVREAFGEPNPGAEAALPLEEMVAMAGAGPDLDWYLAATCHKYAAILGYNLGLHRRGRRIDPIYEELLRTIPGLIDAGLGFLD